MNKVKDIIVRFISFLSAKLGYTLLPIKEIKVNNPVTVDPTGTEEKPVTERISEEQKVRILELFEMIKEHNFVPKVDLGDPKEPLNEIIRKVETGDYEKGILKRVVEAKQVNNPQKNGGVKEFTTEKTLNFKPRKNIDDTLEPPNSDMTWKEDFLTLLKTRCSIPKKENEDEK